MMMGVKTTKTTIIKEALRMIMAKMTQQQ